MADKKISWKNKNCPRCGSAVDALETCLRCGRTWSEELETDEEGNITESAEGLEPGKQYQSIKTVGTRKPRKSKFVKNAAELKGEEFKTFSDGLPPQFKQWEIGESDSETEIYRKRSLMRLDSRKLYNQMGLSVRAQESSKAALLWLSKLWEFLDLEEQQLLASTLEHLRVSYETLTIVRQSKIAQATKMEKAMEKAYRQARGARIKAAEQQKKDASKMPAPGQDSEGLGLQPTALNPDELMEQAKEKLLELEKAKDEAKTKRRNKDENPFDSE